MQGVLQSENMNRSYPLLVDPTDDTLCIICCEVDKRTRSVKPDHADDLLRLAKQKEQDLGKA
jgi:hypothetical protein